jgi:hypothetical protein
MKSGVAIAARARLRYMLMVLVQGLSKEGQEGRAGLGLLP